MKWGGIGIAAIVVLGIASSLFGGESDDSSTTAADTSTTQSEVVAVAGEEEAPADASADEVSPAETDVSNLALGETFTTRDSLDVTVGSFTPTAPDYFGETDVCADITLVNNGSDQASFSGFGDWKLQNPAGVITDPTFAVESTLNSGELAPGGSVSGAICFDGSAPGEYRLTYEKLFSFRGEPATWVVAL